MPINQETLNRRLYKVLHNRFKDTKGLDSEGDVSPIEDDADVFRFTFVKDGKKYGTVYVTVDNSKTLKIYYDDDVTDSPSVISAGSQYNDTWYGFTEFLKRWAMSNQLGWEPTDKDHLEGDMARRNHVKKQENMMEGYYPMGKKASYSDAVPSVKMVIQHTREIQEGEQRYRNVAKIFLENNQGERILAPTTKPGIAKVYARHIAEGGLPHDDRWNHIKGLCEEYSKMAGFVRATRGKQFNESAQGLIESGINHYSALRESLSKMAGHRGYNMYFESWTPPLMEDETDTSSINELFVQETMDPRIESVMPILSKLHKTVAEMKEVDALAEWADSLIEDESLTSNNPVGIPEGYDDEDDYDVKEGKTGPGLWANIHAKQERIKHGSGEKMRKTGSKGAPTAQNFRDAAKEDVEENRVPDGRAGDILKRGVGNADKMTDPKSTRADVQIAKNRAKKTIKDRLKSGVHSPVALPEELDANQKRVGQLGPTEKVKNNNIGKLVGANENFINTTAQAVVTEGGADYGDLENEYYYVIDAQTGEVVDGPFDNVGEVPLRLMGYDGGHKVKTGAELKGLSEAKSDDPDYDKDLSRFKKGLPPKAMVGAGQPKTDDNLRAYYAQRKAEREQQKQQSMTEGQEDLDAILRIIKR